jgi:hypothetical protein
MMTMRAGKKLNFPLRYAAMACLVATIADCDGAGSRLQLGVLPPSQILPIARSPFRVFLNPDVNEAGVYASSYFGTSVLGFNRNYRRGRGPHCLEYAGPNRQINDIAVDPEGNLIVPESAAPHEVIVYGGPGMCGSVLGAFNDRFGSPGSAASLNAATGTILLADFDEERGKFGNIAVCDLKNGCTKKLTSPNVAGYGSGVALAKNGDCWLTSGYDGASGVAMTYWQGCRGRGEAATGFQGASTGGLSIDKRGNLVSVDWLGGTSGQLWVYSGCNPACTLIGGPFPLQGNPVYGAFDSMGDHFGVMEEGLFGVVDVYKYRVTKLTYDYSFNTGIATSVPLGFAYSPALDQ